MLNTQFEVGKRYGNDLTITILSKTKSTITFESDEFGIKRVKLREYFGNESIQYKCWIILSDNQYDVETSRNIYQNKWN